MITQSTLRITKINGSFQVLTPTIHLQIETTTATAMNDKSKGEDLTQEQVRLENRDGLGTAG